MHRACWGFIVVATKSCVLVGSTNSCAGTLIDTAEGTSFGGRALIFFTRVSDMTSSCILALLCVLSGVVVRVRALLRKLGFPEALPR